MAVAQTLIHEDDEAPGGQLDADLQTLQSPPGGPARQSSRPISPPETELVAVDDADLAALQPQQQQEQQQQQEREESVAGDTQETYLAEQRRRATEPKSLRRQRQQRAREHSTKELDFLRRRVAELEEHVQSAIEPRLTNFDTAQRQQTLQQLDRDINGQASLAKDAHRRLAEAVTNADTEALSKALEDRDRAIMAGQQLTVRRNMLASGNPLGGPPQQQQQQRQVQAPPRLSAAVQDRVDDFMGEHPWYNPHDPRSTDSKIVLQIDNALATEGFLPDTDAYWDEMDARARKYLPWRFEEEDGAAAPAQQQQQRNGRAAPRQQQQQQQRQVAPQLRGPAVGAPADRGPQLKPNQVYISPERKQAMVLAGALDADGRTITNRDKYNGYLKQYADFDRANSVARQ